VYALLDRAGTWMIERFDDALNTDAALAGNSDTPVSTWSGLGHLEGRRVAVIADGVVRGEASVLTGRITLDAPARQVEAGLTFAHTVEPLPPNLLGQVSDGDFVRLVEVGFRLEDTAALRVDLGRGLFDMPLHRFGPQPAAGAPPRVSGDRRL